MWLKLTSANFVTNIGTLNQYSISSAQGTCNPSAIEKTTTSTEVTVTLRSGLQLSDTSSIASNFTVANATLGTVTEITAGSSYKVALSNISGDVSITVAVTSSGGSEGDGDTTDPTPDGTYAIYDSFDRANTDDGIGSTDTGETWEAIVGPTDTGKALLKIYNGMVKGNTAEKYPSAVVTATELDRYVEMEIAINKGGGQILVYDKYQDATNYIAVRKAADGIITLLKKIDGINTEVATTTEKYTDDNLIIAIQCIGNNHTVFANGTQILTGTISEFASATKVGFSINETSDMCDNFKVKYL